MVNADLRISLASWSMHRMFFEEGLDLLGMVDLTGEYGIEGFEFVNTFFPAPQFRYLQGVRDRCAEHGITPLLIMCDGEGNLAIVAMGILGAVHATDLHKSCSVGASE